MDEYFKVLQGREADINHVKSRDEIIRHIFNVHCGFSENRIRRKCVNNVPSWEMVQLAVIYMDLYLMKVDVHNEQVLALACYILAYKYAIDIYENDIVAFVKKMFGKSILRKVLIVEMDVWEKIEYKTNYATPLEYVDEYLTWLEEDDPEQRKKIRLLTMKLLISDLYASPASIVALFCILLGVNQNNIDLTIRKLECVGITNSRDIVDSRDSTINTIDYFWEYKCVEKYDGPTFST